MNFKILENYIELCKSIGVKPSWLGFKIYYYAFFKNKKDK